MIIMPMHTTTHKSTYLCTHPQQTYMHAPTHTHSCTHSNLLHTSTSVTRELLTQEIFTWEMYGAIIELIRLTQEHSDIPIALTAVGYT